MAANDEHGLYRVLVTAAPDALMAIDVDSNLLLWNPAAERMFGRSEAEMLGRPLTALMPARYRPMHTQGMARYMATGVRGVDWRAVLAVGLRASGEEFPISISFAETEYGGARAFLGFIRDLTAEQEAARALREAHRLRETLLTSVGEGIVGLDGSWRVLFANPAAAEILGTQIPDLVGADFHALTQHTGHGQAEHDLEECIISGELLRGQTVHFRNQQFLRANGTRVTVEVTLTPLARADASQEGIVVAFRDIEDRLRLEEQLRQSQKMEAIGQLAGGIAHDFNNLLSAITGNLSFVREDLQPDHPVQPDLDAIDDAARRAALLVRQLLTFSRKQPSRPQQIRVGDLVQASERLLERLIGEEIRLEVTVPAAGGVAVVDPVQLEHVLLNLAVNARDAMLTPMYGHPGRGGVLSIDVDETRAGNTTKVRLRVRDTGHGMPPDVQARIFEPFFTTKALGSGTGLGLATAFGVIQQAGGEIEVVSAPGHGTTLTILLPAAEWADVSAGSGAARAVRGATGTILLVEDERAVRTVAKRTLERAGFAVIEASDGAEALAIWGKERARVDAVVTDVRMPVMGGVELVAQLRTAAPTLPVVFMSGYAAPDEAPITEERSRFLMKPFTSPELTDAVLAVLRAASYRG